MKPISRSERPWGFYEILLTEPGIQIKRITVNDMQQLSLQTHEHRDEYWFCTSGSGLVTVDTAEVPIYPGAFFQILRGEKHRVKALGGTLVFIEVQQGAYTGEDDIVRYEDNYGRSAGVATAVTSNAPAEYQPETTEVDPLSAAIVAAHVTELLTPPVVEEELVEETQEEEI
jgi:mannose-6-phosphate isomerase-like protein (cupin superfamily)